MIRTSVKKTYTVLVGIVLVLILGAISFVNLKTDLLPSINLPYVVVVTAYPGATPEKVETSVTRPLETALATTGGLKNISSTSSENVSVITLEFSDNTNMDSVLIEISGAVDQVKGNFDEMVSSPTFMKLDPNMLPIIMASIDVSGMDIQEISNYANDVVIPAIERIDGVASVSADGLTQPQLKIVLNQEKIDEINDEMVKHIDSDLYASKRQLNNGVSALKSASNELVKQKDKFYTELSTASVALENAIDTYNTYQNDLNKYTTIVLLSQNEMATRILTNLASSTIGDTALYIEKMIEDGILLPSDNPLTIPDKLASLLEQNTMTLAMMGYDVSSSFIFEDDLINQLTVAQINQTNSQQLVNNYSKIKEQLTTQYNTLQKQEMDVVTEFTKNEVSLSNQTTELNNALKEFENARDQALDSANIDSIVTPKMISNILIAQNFSMPAGYLGEGDNRYTVKVGDVFTDVEQLSSLLLFDLGIDGMSPVYLSDVADITLGDNSDENFTKVNGNDAIILTVQKNSVSSTNEVSSDIAKEFARLQDNNPDLNISTFMDQGVYIDLITDSVMGNLGWGALIALIVLWIFLKDIKPTLIIGISIPISLLFTVVLMYFSNVTLNIISLSGLALGVGMLVDNSIVVIENIYRLRKAGVSVYRAAVMGASEVAGAIAASTLTTICVFLPIVFVQGISRQLFTDMGLTIGYSLFASLLVAVTVVPAFASMTFKNINEKEHRWFDRMVDKYAILLEKCLNQKWIVIVLTSSLLVLSGFAVFTMPTSFIPEMDSTQLSAVITFPEETTEEEAQEEALLIADELLTINDIDIVAVMGDGGNSSFMSQSSGGEGQSISLYVLLKEDKKLTNLEVKDEMIRLTEDNNVELEVTTSNMDISALGGSGIAVNIKGNNLDVLQEIATDLGTSFRAIDGVETVIDGTQERQVETRVIVDKNKASEYGLTVATIYQEVANYLTIETNSTTLNIDLDEISVVVNSPETPDYQGLEDLEIPTSDGSVKLSKVAEIGEAYTPQSISRDNQGRTQTVTANISSTHSINFVNQDIVKVVENYQFPEGYTYELTGENETISSAIYDLVLMILLAITFVYLIMVAQFQSLLSPFIVIFTIPLAFTGGIIALFITGLDLSVVSMLGFLILSGVVVNNGIVFVDYVNQLRLQGLSKREALIQTGKARIRPILMTAFTTILAMSTMALGGGMAGALNQAMSIVTIGGLLYATILTLFLVPTIYDIIHKKEIKDIDKEIGEII